MTERYFHIAPDLARGLLKQISDRLPSSRGIDRHAYLVDEYAVLSTNRLKLRNVDTRDDDFRYLHEIIERLWSLREQGVSVIPILGYCCEENSRDGSGYLIQQRAVGSEM